MLLPELFIHNAALHNLIQKLHFLDNFYHIKNDHLDNMPSHLSNLNPEQEEAVKHHEGPILILAGAGTGKTRVLTRRVANLIIEHNVPPDRILAVTFTNKATGEMRERLHQIMGESANRIWISTFHSAALRILRRTATKLGYKPDFIVYDTQDSLALIKEILKKLNIKNSQFKPGFFISGIEGLKNEMIEPEDFEPIKHLEGSRLLAQVYEEYQKALMQANAMDFTDLICNCLKVLNEFPEVRGLYQRQLKFILVDEFQDTNMIQYNIVRHLAAPENNLLVVGDDDQSIYAFRGADIRNILSFEKHYPDTKVIKLEQNYRSTQNILNAAYGVISKNKKRKEKKLWTASEAGELIALRGLEDEYDEAQYIIDNITQLFEVGKKPKDIAVFYRINAQSRALEDAFMRAGVPYRIFGSVKFYERKEVKDILAYLRLLHNGNDFQALSRIINVPRRGIGARTLQQILNYAEQHNASAFNAMKAVARSNPKIKKFAELISELSQLHKSNSTTAELMRAIIEKTQYLKMFEDKTDPKNEDRQENIAEFVAMAERFSSENENSDRQNLSDFLDHIVLMTSSDISNGNTEDEHNYVSLMTLHIAKGLEFPVVFLTGLEKGLLPHIRSINEGTEDEERRLCYVGITRAMQKLFLTYATSRGMYSASSTFGYGGGYRYPSQFLSDIPGDLLDGSVTDSYYDFDDDFFEYEEELYPKKNKGKSKGLNIDKLLVTADDL